MNFQNHSKKIFAGISLILVCGTVLSASLIISGRPMYIQANGFSAESKNNISVNAEGKITVKPDLAMFTVGYQVKKSNLKDVQNELDSMSQKIYSALRNYGINDKDIQTTDYSISPNYYWDNNRQYSDGHSGSVSVQVKVRQIEKVGELIDATVDAGANNVGGVYFTVENEEKYKEKARILATELAKEKAKTLAEAADASLGGLLYITESSYTPSPYYRYSMDMVKVSDSASPQISAGSFEVSVTVSATFAIE